MPSGWDTYYVVCLSAVLALGIPATLGLIAWFASRNRSVDSTARTEEMETRIETRQEPIEGNIGLRTNVRFFSGVNVAMLLIAFGLILIPCSAAFKADSEGLTEQLFCILSICVLAGLGLLYGTRKGDLEWLSGFKDAGVDRGEPRKRGEKSEG